MADSFTKIAKDHFNGKCPHTGKSCDDWNCINCWIDLKERESLEGEVKIKLIWDWKVL